MVLRLEHFLWLYMLFNLLFFTFALESIIIFTWVLLILTSFWIQGDLHLMMIHVLLIVFIDVACLYFADFNMIVNFVVGKCLVVQWREFWFNIFWLIFFLNSVYKYQHGVFFGTASVHDFVFCGADFCWCWLCWLYWFGCLFAEYMFLDLCCGLMLFFFHSRFVQFSSILLDKVEAFAIAFAISSVLFSVRLVSFL